MSPGTTPGLPTWTRVVKTVAGRVGGYVFVCVVALFFAVPLVWLVTTPFSKSPSYLVEPPSWYFHNFQVLLDNPYALESLKNSVVLAGVTAALVVLMAGTASYALSRVRIPGRDLLLYVILLLSSIVTGTAAMVPTFLMLYQVHLIDSQLGVILAMTGGLLPAAIFIMKDFMDTIPKSYEESARVCGAKPLQILRHIVAPIVRPGLATIAVWAVVNVWGNFLLPYILLRDPDKQPGAVVMFTFYDEGGQPDFALIASFSLIYSIPVIAMFLFVNKRYGFRFQGGIKA